MNHALHKPNPAFGGPGWVRELWSVNALDMYPNRLADATIMLPFWPAAFDGAARLQSLAWGIYR